MDKPYHVMPDVAVLPLFFPIPGMGFLPVNAFVIKAKEPVLVDTIAGGESEEFMKALESVIDPRDLKWVWLTHDDSDHAGNIQKVLEAAPGARFAANALATLRMTATWQVPMDRVYWLNPGDSINAGDRRLTAVRPPLFDNPSTIGIYDDKSQAFFSADCFGGIIKASARDADDIKAEELTQGMVAWSTADSPWVHMVEPGKFGQALDGVRRMAPKAILSSHLPPARGSNERFLKLLLTLPAAQPFVAPGQVALEQLMAQMKGAR